MKNKLILLAICCFSLGGKAQMAFTFKAEPTSIATDSRNVTTVTLPVGTELTGCITGVSVDGITVDADDVIPNPTTTVITDKEIEVFVYRDKAYSFRFTSPTDTTAYFTMVIVSDPHIEQGNGTPKATMQTYVQNIINMGKEGGKQFTFNTLKGYVPTADIVFCLGDMDQDSEKTGDNFKSAFAQLNTARIPFITMLGNHDYVPDYWEGGDLGVTYGSSGGHACNEVALNVVETQLNTVNEAGYGMQFTKFSDDNYSASVTQQPYPFVIRWRGINFYCGQTFWFQKLYTKPTISNWNWGNYTPVNYWSSDGIIAKLEAYAKAHCGEGSIFMQHYPIVAGSDCDRWWMGLCKPGYIEVQTNDKGATNYYPTVRAKKQKYAQIMNMCKNPVHFSGHTHSFSQETYEGITDYTVASPGQEAGNAYIVLCRDNWGVVEVKQVQFGL
ncbi:MAG: metallophosphoesterase [Bacteroidaceae bacterium]|nr:metallophosphoesterase [Bacteroidaceae bacterium]